MTQKRVGKWRHYTKIECPICQRPTVLHWLKRHMWAQHSQVFIDQVEKERATR